MPKIIYYWNYLRTGLVIRTKRLFDLLLPNSNSLFTKFVILGHARTGTTLLHTYLNSHIYIRSLGEMPRDRYRGGGEEFSVNKDAFCLKNERVKAVGFKVFYKYATHDYFKHVYDQVLEDKTIKIIHLTRRSYLDLYLSLFKARESGHWSYSGKPLKGEVPESIPVDHFLKEKKKYNQSIDEFESAFTKHEVLRLDYEDLVANPKETLDKAQQFLGVPKREMYSVLRKQTSGEARAMVANLNEIMRADNELTRD